MFHPEEVIFAPTGQCNLRCAHCRVSRPAARLDAKEAIAFLDSLARAAAPIDRVGFSGGEPFLEPDFICEVSAAALERGLFFDRLMTNGVWFRDDAQLTSILGRVADSGFDGRIGLSVDRWHDQDEGKLLAFIAAAFEAFGRRDCVDILYVRAPDEGPATAKLSAIARRFGGRLIAGAGEPEAIRDPRYDLRRAQGEDIPEALSIGIFRFPYSPAADEGAWEAASWFADDLCEGPGNVLYVHPDGRIAACCGFANENEELIIGNLGQDDYASVMAKAAANPHIAACYERGLGAERERLEAAGFAFPGKTSDMCFFCDWICKNKPMGTR
jgi:hypothetical protein